MITLIPLTDHPFYLWQALVQHSAGVDATWLIYRHNRRNSEYLNRFTKSGAKFVVWDDWRSKKNYNPMMKPALVGHWLNANPTDEAVMVIDPDVIPTGQPLPTGQSGVILGTDTDHYTGPEWLKSKGVWELLCGMLGADPVDVARYPGIGAQYIFRDIPGEWWLEVAERSVSVYETLRKHPVDAQPWCAEMYVTHILAARDGYRPTASDRMQMFWADGKLSDWDEMAFFHDAGQTKSNGRDFCKKLYQMSPFNQTIAVHQDSASSWYVDLIKETEQNYPDLVW